MSSRSRCRPYCSVRGLLFLIVGLTVLPAERAGALERTGAAQDRGTVRGVTTILDSAVVLPGVTVRVRDPVSGAIVAEAISDNQGGYELSGLPAGTFTLTASLEGFADAVEPAVTIDAGPTMDVNFNLAVASLEEGIDVVADAGEPREVLDTGMLVESLEGELVDLLPVRGENFDALLPLLPGVVRGLNGRLSVKGGQATQTSLRVNSVNVSDPVTGEFGTTLPDDAVDTVRLLPNPYAAEYGGFSAGRERGRDQTRDG